MRIFGTSPAPQTKLKTMATSNADFDQQTHITVLNRNTLLYGIISGRAAPIIV
jgi:hypothetical protein